MTGERLPLAELLAKGADGDFLRSVAEAVLQMPMEADGEGNGFRDRTPETRLGQMQLRIPVPPAVVETPS
jgi:hypothetical protein